MMQPFSQIPSNPDLHGPDLHGPDVHGPNLHGPNLHGPNLHGPNLHGVVELARMQIAMQRELTALRTQKLVLTQQQMSRADRQATTHLSAELREARTQISALRQDAAKRQQALDQAQASLADARKSAETDKARMARDIAKHRAECEKLCGVVDEIKASRSWRIGNGIVRMAKILLWPVARLKGAPQRTPA